MANLFDEKAGATNVADHLHDNLRFNDSGSSNAHDFVWSMEVDC
ncbi:hypothetical protein ABID39_001069 [Bartonella japonica]|uniref:Uncharacterized protein n=1 Tax=Bartonella japonica TaxID=357761 RepID=A0ABV2FPJ2_9HYPH